MVVESEAEYVYMCLGRRGGGQISGDLSNLKSKEAPAQATDREEANNIPLCFLLGKAISLEESYNS